MFTIRCYIHPRHKVTSKPRTSCETCKLLYVLAHQGKDNQEKLLKEVDSELATTIGGDKWSDFLECIEISKKSDLSVKCRNHSYQATRKPGWDCDACWLLFVLKYQAHKEGERRLGPFNPYGHVIDHVDLKKACANLKIIRK